MGERRHMYRLGNQPLTEGDGEAMRGAWGDTTVRPRTACTQLMRRPISDEVLDRLVADLVERLDRRLANLGWELHLRMI
jgi:hypothetical protein